MNRDVIPPSPDEQMELARNINEAEISPLRPAAQAARMRRPEGPRANEPAKQFDPYREALRALRGRIRLAIVLAILGAAAGIAAVMHTMHPFYKSEGLVQIAYTRPAIMMDTDQNAPMAMFDAHLISQIRIIHSRGLLEKALHTQIWKDAELPTTPDIVEAIDEGLVVDHPHGTDHLKISFMFTNPNVAALTVNAVIQAFKEDYESRGTKQERTRLAELQKNKEHFQSDLSVLHGKLASLTQSGGTADLESRYTSAIERRNLLESQLRDVRYLLGMKKASTTAPAVDVAVMELSAARIALNDEEMRGYLNQRVQMEDEISQLKRRYNWGDQHPDIVERHRRISDIDKRIEDRKSKFSALQGEIQLRVGMAGNQNGAMVGTPEIQEQVIVQLIDTANKDVVELAKARDQAMQLSNEATKLAADINLLNDRIRLLQIESGGEGRFRVISEGEVPVKPMYDPRMKYGAAAALFGAGLPVGILVLIGMLGGKYRFVHETENKVAPTTPMLGMLPSLPEKIKDMRLAADAAHAVHQIRVMLQSGSTKGRGVFMVTSATSGEGKTNLTMALGLSFAASGCKTLVIDCDLVGQGITRGLRAEQTTGLREALDNGSVRGFVKKLPQGLRTLTAGNADTLNGWTLSSAATNRMLGEVRRYYDVVLIDTGPILGSVEATVLAPTVDGVILTISRGQQKVLVDRAMTHLASLGAEPAGFVFNRARSVDYRYSSYHSSVRYTSRPAHNSDNLPEMRTEDTSEVAAFGPLVRSVATFMRASAGGDAD